MGNNTLLAATALMSLLLVFLQNYQTHRVHTRSE